MRGLVDCSRVYVDGSERGGVGAFAACDLKAGDLVEAGIVRRLPGGFDGHESPHVFTWSEDRTVWAIGSGCSTFYNCDMDPNTTMTRDYATDSFKIYALRDIAQGEEFTHVYKSLGWRECFSTLRG